MIESQNHSSNNNEIENLTGKYDIANPEGRKNLEVAIHSILADISRRLSLGPGVDISEITKAISDKMKGAIPYAYNRPDGKARFVPQLGYAIKARIGFHEVKVEIKQGGHDDAYGNRYYALMEIASQPEPGLPIDYATKSIDHP